MDPKLCLSLICCKQLPAHMPELGQKRTKCEYTFCILKLTVSTKGVRKWKKYGETHNCWFLQSPERFEHMEEAWLLDARQVDRNTLNSVVYIQEPIPNLNGKHAELVHLRLLLSKPFTSPKLDASCYRAQKH